MKKHLSVLMLFARSTIYKFLLLIFGMAAVESGIFALAYRSAQGFYGLDTILSAAHLGLVCAVFFLLLCVLLCLTGCEFRSKAGYTLERLRVSHRAVFIWQAVHNAGLLFLFWVAQVGIVLVFCGVYTVRFPQPQAAMLVFYQSTFLHNLFPLSDWSRLVCNVALLLALAVTTACFPIRMRRGQRPLAAFFIISFCVQSFTHKMGDLGYDLAYAAVTLFIAFLAARGVWKEDER